MSKKNIFFIVAAGIGLVGLLYAIFVITSKGESATQINFYKSSAKDRPKLKIESRLKSIGQMKVSEEKSAKFVLENKGTKSLQVFYGTTSCNCTFGLLKTQSKESPVFGMHANQDFLIEIASGQKANLEVIYKPYLMPVYGKVQREAIIKTNDPDNPEVSFAIEAFVK